MKFWKDSVSTGIRLITKIFEKGEPTVGLEIQQLENFPSAHLRREVRVDVFLPPQYFERPGKRYPVLYFNDGQDMGMAGMAGTLEQLYASKALQHLVVVAIHAGDRIQEYGTAGRPDYKNRGSKAGAYTSFLLEELIPALHRRYRLSETPRDAAFAGFSLGGLSAFDIAWNHPQHFSKIGVFSGALWWRHQAFTPDNPDAFRIIHEVVRENRRRDGMRFWFQCGTNDETDDRNNNGVIDAIDDTLDLIKELEQKGYRNGQEITYVEVQGGEHNHHTWAKILPDFLIWAFGKPQE
ncbi:MAG: esterase family protein [Saprospiraceae bacterium]|nr:esterase family protein [Saprospiraceae bacterium]